MIPLGNEVAHALAMAQTLGRQGNKALELSFWEKAISLNPNIPHTHLRRGGLKLDSCEYDEAEREFTRAIELRPRFQEAYCSLGVSKSRRGRLEEAIRDYDKGLKAMPRGGNGLFHRGAERDGAILFSNKAGAYDKLGDYNAAIRESGAAASLDPEYAGSYINRAHARLHLGQHLEMDGALENCDKAIELDKSSGEAYAVRAVVKAVSKEYDSVDVMVDACKAVELEPENPDVHYLRGLALAETGDDEEAIASFSRVLESMPNHAESFLNRANARQRLGGLSEASPDFKEALRCFDRFLEDNPSSARGCLGRAQSNAGLGLKADARRDFERVRDIWLNLTPQDNVNAGKVEAVLATL
ncbi:MAG: tetratricopeptide repeat protein [Methanobacteriota archaeon]